MIILSAKVVPMVRGKSSFWSRVTIPLEERAQLELFGVVSLHFSIIGWPTCAVNL